MLRVAFSSSYSLDAAECTLFVESSTDLKNWTRLLSNGFSETARDDFPATGTSHISIGLHGFLPSPDPGKFYRAGWNLR